MCTTCIGCGSQLVSSGKRGPKKQKCVRCKAKDSARRRRDKRSQYAGRHGHVCQNCNKSFFSERRRQKFCSQNCCRLANRNRSVITCANQSCGRQFDVTPSMYAKGTRCCSRKCRAERMRIAGRICQNPACHKPIERESSGESHKKYGKDSGKYCCTQCYHDHRWGENRPRKQWPAAHVQAASRHSLQTSLRKKCKLLAVPYDPECQRHAVCLRDHWACQMCGIECLKEWTFDKHNRQIDPRSAEHDHIIALTAKGSPGNIFPNSQCLCHACNHRKRDTAWGQLRLDLEGSVKRWEEGGLARSRRSSKSCVEIPAAGRSTKRSRSRQAMAL